MLTEAAPIKNTKQMQNTQIYGNLNSPKGHLKKKKNNLERIESLIKSP